jgi:hypothetical protein
VRSLSDSTLRPEERAQHTCEIWLWLCRHDPAVKGCKRAHTIADVRSDVEHEVAGCDEIGVQTPEPPLAQRDRVIHGQGAREADAAVNAAHVPIP